jgi:hypothetical protein
MQGAWERATGRGSSPVGHLPCELQDHRVAVLMLERFAGRFVPVRGGGGGHDLI